MTIKVRKSQDMCQIIFKMFFKAVSGDYKAIIHVKIEIERLAAISILTDNIFIQCIATRMHRTSITIA